LERKEKLTAVMVKGLKNGIGNLKRSKSVGLQRKEYAEVGDPFISVVAVDHTVI
jgi:hypothetical protein